MNHDKTYFGNGCASVDGSYESCSTRTVEQYQNVETQFVGVYYDFQAATSGSGGSIITDNTNSPDTFCPLGWQLPYSGTGGDYYNKSRSWEFLLAKYNNGENPLTNNPVIYYYPFDYALSGGFYWPDAKLYRQGTIGYYWSFSISEQNKSYALDVGGLYQYYQTTKNKNEGKTLRCVLIFSIHSSTARWKEQVFIIQTFILNMIIHIMGMVAQMSGTGQSPMRGMVARIKLVRLESKKLMMVRIWKLVPTIISKLQALVLAHQLLLKTPIFPILSALLVGSCLTVARVGIIMISLNHGYTY